MKIIIDTVEDVFHTVVLVLTACFMYYYPLLNSLNMKSYETSTEFKKR